MPFPKYFQEDLSDIFDSLADNSIPTLTAKAVTHTTAVLLISLTGSLLHSLKEIKQLFDNPSPSKGLSLQEVSVTGLQATASLGLRLLAFLPDNLLVSGRT